MDALTQNDLKYVVQRLPRDVRDLLDRYQGKLFVAGGFIRATIAGEVPNDIDMFGHDKEWLHKVATGFVADRSSNSDMETKMHVSKNAITVITPNRMPIQFITRWTFDSVTALVESFDFTICQAAIWKEQGKWYSRIKDGFYLDLAGRRLVYTSPKREEEAGGSMMRVIKYVKRGYSIQVASLGAVIARVSAGVKLPSGELANTEFNRGVLTAALLREVDPLLVIDGFEVVDDHAPIEGEE